MCYLCKKVQALHYTDTKALKPVYLALARLHRISMSKDDEYWQRRYDGTVELRKALEGSRKVLPATELANITRAVNDVELHCTKQLAAGRGRSDADGSLSSRASSLIYTRAESAAQEGKIATSTLKPGESVSQRVGKEDKDLIRKSSKQKEAQVRVVYGNL